MLTESLNLRPQGFVITITEQTAPSRAGYTPERSGVNMWQSLKKGSTLKCDAIVKMERIFSYVIHKSVL